MPSNCDYVLILGYCDSCAAREWKKSEWGSLGLLAVDFWDQCGYCELSFLRATALFDMFEVAEMVDMSRIIKIQVYLNLFKPLFTLILLFDCLTCITDNEASNVGQLVDCRQHTLLCRWCSTIEKRRQRGKLCSWMRHLHTGLQHSCSF